MRANEIINAFGGPTTARGNSGPFFVGSGLAALSGIICLLFVPRMDQDCIQEEDSKFRVYLEANGYDTSKMGLHGARDIETLAEDEGKEAL